MSNISEGERLVKLMLFIRESGPVGFDAIRARFPIEYSSETNNDESVRRRFERDKRSLQNLGVFLAVDEDNRYSLDEKKSFAAPIELTSSQASLLRLVCGALLEDEDYKFKSDLRMVLIKLGAELGVPDLLPQMVNSPQFAAKSHVKPQGIDKIRKAIASRKRLSFEYSGASGKQSSREVEPFGCFILKSNCYIVAYDPNAQGDRCFRLDRMKRLRVNSSAPDKPDFEEREFDAREYYGLPFQFGEESFDARIRFDANEAWRCEHLTMGLGSIEDTDDGVIWTISCNDSDALVRWCIEHYPEAKLVGPKTAVDAYDEHVKRSAQVFATLGEEAAR